MIKTKIKEYNLTLTNKGCLRMHLIYKRLKTFLNYFG